MSAFEDAELVMAPRQTRLMQFLPQLGASSQQSALGLAWDLVPAPSANASSIQIEAKTMQSSAFFELYNDEPPVFWSMCLHNPQKQFETQEKG